MTRSDSLNGPKVTWFHVVRLPLTKLQHSESPLTSFDKIRAKKFIKSHRNHRNKGNCCIFVSIFHLIMTDNEITFEIRGAIYDVYKKLGPGLLESVYEEALV